MSKAQQLRRRPAAARPKRMPVAGAASSPWASPASAVKEFRRPGGGTSRSTSMSCRTKKADQRGTESRHG